MTDSSPDGTGPVRVLLIGDARSAEHDHDPGSNILELVKRLPEARAVVVSRTGARASDRVRTVRSRRRPLALHLATLTRAIRNDAQGAKIIDLHIPLYGFLPIFLGMLRGKFIVVRPDDSSNAENLQRAASTRRRSVRRALERYVYRHALLVVASNSSTARALIERYGVSPWRVKTKALEDWQVRLGPDDRPAARRRLSLPAEAFVVSYVNASAPSEIRVLLTAWGELLAARRLAGDSRPMRLLIAAPERRGLLGVTTLRREFSDSVTVLGRTSDGYLHDVIHAADINVAISRGGDARAIALAVAAGGTPSITADTQTGFEALDATLVVPPDDPRVLARRLAAAADGDLPGRGATQTWAAQRGWDVAAALRRHLYDDLVSEHPPAVRNIRVVYLGHVAQMSGGEIALARLIDSLIEVDAHVILAEAGPLVGQLEASGISVEVLPLRERTRDLRKDRVRPTGLPVAALFDTAMYVLRLARRIRAIRPDLVHTNTLKAGVYGSLAARLLRVPVVWHVRDRVASDYLGHSTVLLVRGLIAALPDAVIVNSEATGRTLWRPRGHTRAIYSSVADPVSWRPVARPVRHDRFVVGMVGRIAPWKGQHVFIQAFAEAFGDGSETAIIVGAPMFGGAERDYDAGLHDLVRSLGVSDRFIFRGFRTDIWRELIEMDILVHASITPEPFGQVIVEAMLAGTPVIASAGGGPSEIVTDGIDGLLYPAGDVNALVAALHRLRRDPALRTGLSNNAYARAAQFSPQVTAAAVMSLYRRVLATSEAEAT